MSTVHDATTSQDAAPEKVHIDLQTEAEVDQIEAEQVKAEQVKAEQPEAVQVEVIEQVEVAEQVEVTEQVDAEQAAKEQVKAEQVKAEQVKADAEQVEADQLEQPQAPQAVQRKLSHDPSVTLEYVIESGGGNAEELRLSKELQQLVPTARPDQIVRFLRARKMDVQAAAKMLRKHHEWREQNVGPDLLNPEKDADLKEELLKNKIVFFGKDKQGNKVVILRGKLLGKHTYKDIEIAKRALIQIGEVMESMCEPLEKCVILASNKDTTGKNNDLDWLKHVANLFQHNYPERLLASHSAPNPMWLRMIWGVARYFFDPDTRAKLFLHSNDAVYLDLVSPEHLPVDLGGESVAPFSSENLLKPVHVPGKST